MKDIIKYILLLFILVNTHLSFGRHYKTIDVSDGLSNNTVKSIAQDENGFMWFGTFDGLCRYDGIKFTIYRTDKDDPFSIINNHITSLLAVHDGLFIGTISGLEFLSFEDYKFYHCEFRDEEGKNKPINGYIHNIIPIGSSVYVHSGSEGLLHLKADSQRST